MAFSAQTTFAHAKLLRSHPANGEKLQEAPKAVVLTFSEQLQPTEINSIVVTDSNGRRVDKNVLLFSTGGKRMTAALEEIGAGIFTVEWKALSADDHLMKGKFTFTVAEKKTPENAATPQITATPTISENVPTISENQTPPAQETGTLPFHSLVRWLLPLGGFKLYFIRPRVEKPVGAANLDENSSAIKDFQFVLFLETAFAAVILLSAAILAFLPHSQEHHTKAIQNYRTIKPVIAALNGRGTIENERK